MTIERITLFVLGVTAAALGISAGTILTKKISEEVKKNIKEKQKENKEFYDFINQNIVKE
jgi:hypothetical protein